jgi:hypothetical protein
MGIDSRSEGLRDRAGDADKAQVHFGISGRFAKFILA